MSTLERCPGCGKMKPNVGPWKSARSSHARLCGGCKVRETFATPGFKEQLAQDCQRFATAVDVALDGSKKGSSS